MRRPAPALLAPVLSALTLTLACASRPASTPSTTPLPEVAVDTPALVESTPTPTPPTTLALTRALPSAAMTEVILDPRGVAAITLDKEGGVRLWNNVREANVDTPVVLPLEEPAWVTLARASDDRLVIASIDTAGATRVGEVERAAEGPRWRPLFEIPASDPHLEIHVLDGGERLLALSLDHRLRLLDRAGKAVATLDVPGFIPWQLRLAHQAEGPPKIVAILAGPVRAQPIGMDGDTLAIQGEARRIDLDRGPNRNDVILSPDGTFVTSLRRPRAEGKAWSLELIDLATDGRRWIAGDVDGTVRPRLLLVDNERALLDAGTGKGHLVDLRSAKDLPLPVDRKKLAKTRSEGIELAGSTEDSRMLGDFAGGIRVFATGDQLHVDALDGSTRQVITHRRFLPSLVAVDRSAERLAWTRDGSLMVEGIGEDAPLRTLGDPITQLIGVAFVDREHVLVAGGLGEYRLVRWADGSSVVATSVRGANLYDKALYHPSAEGQGVLAFAKMRGRKPLDLVDIRVDTAAPGTVASVDRGEWPERLESTADRQAVAERVGVSDPKEQLAISRGVRAGDRTYLLFSEPLRIDLFDGSGRRSAPLDHDPITHLVGASGRARVAYSAFHLGAEVSTTVVVLDYDGATPTRLWSRAFTGNAIDLAWSADGSRLAIASGEGGFVVDGATGETLHARTSLGLDVTPLGPRGAGSRPTLEDRSQPTGPKGQVPSARIDRPVKPTG